MPSARPSTSMRTSTPHSPRYEGTSRPSSRGQAYQPRSPQAATSRRAYGNNLTLPGLPRFHPANYPSAQSSFVTTPTSGPSSPRSMAAPALPAQKMYGESQRALFVQARDHLPRISSTVFLDRPGSPRLAPLGSPGPVTPFELEAAESYIASGQGLSDVLGDNCAELTEKLSQAARQREKSAVSTSAPARSR